MIVKLIRPEVYKQGNCTIYKLFKQFCLAALMAEEIIRRALPALLFFQI
ncbi:MAG: hypothetical protein ABFD75_12450 [Smithella sp.]